MSPRTLRALSAATLLAACTLAPPARAAITIGSGPAVGTDRAGVTWYEEFQDWTHADLRALDQAGLADAVYDWNDGFKDSRDLVAFYSRFENRGGQDDFLMRVDLHDLALGAENGNLDLYVAIDCAPGGQVWLPDFLDVQTDRPWEVVLGVYRSGTVAGTDFRLYDRDFNQPWNSAYLGSHFNSELDAVEFGIRRQVLLDAGWDGVSPFAIQVYTAKDGAETNCTGGASGRSSDIADAFLDQDRGCSDGTLHDAFLSTSTAGRVYYASVAHGNQSVNQADDIGSHIYDSAASTGIAGGTGFLRTLDTHQIFKVPLNIHASGSLVIAAQWARRPGGAADPQDGPAFLQQIREFVDADQGHKPGALIGGVFSEHIMPYFEGPVNASSIRFRDSLMQVVFGISAAEAKVMHTPERVIRSQSTGLSPLDGHTFEDIAASPYQATYLDEVTHLHWWFHPGEHCSPEQSYRHKLHRINGVYSFMINDREDQAKFGNHDGGAVMDSRFSLLQHALFGSSSEIVLVFDDWEALAGKSFDPISGSSPANNNPNQYHRTIRWLANKPWVAIRTLRDLLDMALAAPSAFVIDHGMRYDLSLQTYEWLKHASEDSYHNWYYNENAGFAGNEQDFYDLVPVITGEQGDYFRRGTTPASDGPPLPSGKQHGDLNTPGSLMHDAWADLQAAPLNRMRLLGEYGYNAMIYETAWHEEEQNNYTDSNCYGAWLFPDASWDGVNTWALRLQNHVRDVGFYAAAARWADSLRRGSPPAQVRAALDLDHDGEDVLATDRLFAVFERYGGRCELAAVWDPLRQDAEVIVGAPVTNPSAPGEEEYTGQGANRCSGFKEMNDGIYADAVYTVAPATGGGPGFAGSGWVFTSPDGKVVKTVLAAPGSDELRVDYSETVSGPLYVRIGLSPNPLDLMHRGHANLQSSSTPGSYRLWNTNGGAAQIEHGSAAFQASPAWAGWDRRNLALTEEVEVAGEGSFRLSLRMRPDTAFTQAPVTAVGPPRVPRVPLALSPSPVRAGAVAQMTLTLAEAAEVSFELVDAQGRRLRHERLGTRPAGELRTPLGAHDDTGAPLAAGLYFVRVRAGTARVEARWAVLR
jgi:hypothetical protein